MKKVIYLFLLFGLFSCAGAPKDGYTETVIADVYIYKMYTGKYSKVEGYFMYRGLKMYIDNGNSGYHYKKYNLWEGRIIRTQITVYQNYEGDRLILSPSDLNVSMYEKE
jgi:hypothetical protein